MTWWKGDISQKLYLPSDESFISLQTNSWFTIHERKEPEPIDLQSRKRKRQISSQGIKKRKLSEPLVRTMKTRIFPNSRQRKILKSWMGTARFLYNKSVELINKNWSEIKELPKKERNYIKPFDTINKLMGKGCDFTKERLWLKKTPAYPKSNSIRDAFKARKTCFSLMKNKRIKKFKLHFRKKKNGGYLTIPKSLVKKNGVFYSTKLGNPGYNTTDNCDDNSRGSEALKLPKSNPLAKKLIADGLKYDCKLILDSIGKYWLCVPYDKEVDNQNSLESKGECVALDPGVRTFQSFYSPGQGSTTCGEIGKNDINRIYRLCEHLDALQSKKDKAINSKRKRRYRKAWLRLIQRIKNLVNEVHKKTALFLTRNFKTILLPKFETSQMVGNGRNIGSKTARGMMTWAHYRFKEFLRGVCNRTNTTLIDVTEEYTSKTCGQCGNLHPNLGRSKKYVCPACGMKMDRDINAARNIMLKYISENQTSTLLQRIALNSRSL